jgi:hypothetical protein
MNNCQPSNNPRSPPLRVFPPKKVSDIDE